MAQTALTVHPACGYCGAPLPPDALSGASTEGGASAAYCCYGCRLLGESGQKPTPQTPDQSSWFRIGLGGAIAGQGMLLGLAVNLAKPAGLAYWLFHGALILSCLAVFGILGGPFRAGLREAVRERRGSVELLFLAGMAGAFGASVYATGTGVGDIYYEVVAILLVVHALGKTLGARSRARALAETRRLRDTFDTCRQCTPAGEVLVRAATIQPGDQIRVLAGEPIPVDGEVTRGQAFVRETPLTGEPFPVVRRPGDWVYAGSYSEDGELWIRSRQEGGRRRLDSLLDRVEQARDIPSGYQAQADRIVRWFLPLVLVTALATFAYWFLWAGFAPALYNSLAVLLVACPCALGLATPVAVWNAVSVLAARGLVPQSGQVIERLAGATQVVFDKTGTLSEDAASLIDLAAAGTVTERQEIQAILAAVQKQSAHPVARAFLGLAGLAQEGMVVKSLKPVPARGVEAWVEKAGGQEIHVRLGLRDFMPGLEGEADLLAHLRHGPLDQLVYVAMDGRLRAIGAVRERLRSASQEALALLASLALPVAVYTGDQSARGAQLGLPGVAGSLTPEDKARKIGELQRGGECVVFVGDGVNDALAMQAAGVGIALGQGAALTTATAGAILYGGDLRVVAWAISVCRQVRSAITANLLFAAVYNLAGMALAATGCLHPIASALLMVLSSFTVSWRALRSAESAACCGPELPALKPGAVPAGGPRAPVYMRHLRAVFASRPGQAGLVLAQVPFQAYLGGLRVEWALGLAGLAALLAWAILRIRPRGPELASYAEMTFAMLSWGNWGMLLGWWLDAGGAPIAPLAACCSTHLAHPWQGLVSLPGMNLGMLLLGLPPMLWDLPQLPGSLGRLPLGLLSAAGMLLGMSLGSYFALTIAGQWPVPRFVLSFGGMTLGMLGGMFFGCELARAFTNLWRSRARAR
jgi:heavy metal translocating P-type ATPase